MAAADPLAVAPEDMRRLASLVIDRLVSDSQALRETRVLTQASAGEMREKLSLPAPEQPIELELLLDRLWSDVVPFMSRCDHPRYFAFIPGSSTWVGALADLIASALNVYAGCWMEGAGWAQLELTVLDWFKGWIGYPPEASGILVSGGSAANMTALACAREVMVGAMDPRLVVYVSDQSHSSVARAARVLGFRPDQVRVLPTDRDYRMRPRLLAEAIEADRAAGRAPLLASVSAGSTNTGAIDPLHELADVCQERGVWLHVDAAYGGSAAITDRGRAWLAGIERADSVTLDPHKWMYQPFEVGCLLVREGRQLRSAFAVTPDYLADSEAADDEVSFYDYGLQLTRMTRALKLWLSVSYFGAAAFREAIDNTLDLAVHAEKRIEADDRLELLRPANLGIVCFRRRVEGASEAEIESANAGLVEALARSGFGLVSSTRLQGRYALRLCVLNHASERGDVEAVLDWLASQPLDPPVPGAAVPPAAAGDVRNADFSGWATGQAAPVAPVIASLPLFQGAEADVVARVAEGSHAIRVEAGGDVFKQWEPGGDMYLIVAGEAVASREGMALRTMTAGEYFGELGALDWGATFSYPRTATVTAVTSLELVAVPGPVITRAVRDSKTIGDRIRRTMAERLAADAEAD